MAITVTPMVTGHRPARAAATIAVLVFLGISATAGGTAMMLGIGAAPPEDWLAEIPVIDSWVVPGLVLGIGFGLGSLVTAYGMLRRVRWAWLGFAERLTRHHWSWIATVLIGAGQLAWIAIEVIYLPELSVLQAVYGATGVALLVLPLHPTVRGYLAVSSPMNVTTDNAQVAARTRSPATLLTQLVAALALAASLAGLRIDGIYTGAASTAEMLRGFDLVTAVVIVPGLAVASHLARRGSIVAQLVATSLIAYLVYTYAYYLFGTGFNDLFLLHVAVFGAGLVALVLCLTSLDSSAAAHRFGAQARVRTIAGILGVLAVALGGMWTYFAVDNAVTGDVPAGSQLVETDTIVRLGMALDLTLLVPLYAVTAVLLWRRAAWGYVLATIALVGGILHQVSYIVAMPFQVVGDIPGAVSYDPFEPIIVLLFLAATALLFLGVRPAASTVRRDS
jgi:hypothetical protein